MLIGELNAKLVKYIINKHWLISSTDLQALKHKSSYANLSDTYSTCYKMR